MSLQILIAIKILILILGGLKIFYLKNQYTDLFYNKGTTLLPNRASTILTEDIKAQWLSNTISNLTHLNGSKDFDITTDAGKELFRKAALVGLENLKDQGYSGTAYSGTGNIKMVKNAYEDKIGFQGQGFENSIITQGNYLNLHCLRKNKVKDLDLKDGKELKLVNINDVIKTK